MEGGEKGNHPVNTYTISVQHRIEYRAVVPMKRFRSTKDAAMMHAYAFSQKAALCDVVITRGSKHIVTYRDGQITELNGKAYNE